MVPKNHRKTPQRVISLVEGLINLSKKYPDNIDFITEFPSPARDVVALVHDDTYLQKLESLELTDEPKQIFNESDQSDMDTYVSKNSMEAALKAAGAALCAIQLV